MTSTDPLDPLLIAVVETVLKPLIAADGGKIALKSSSSDAVTIELGGACLGCPGRTYTVQQIITPVIQRARSSVRVVKVIDAVDNEE